MLNPNLTHSEYPILTYTEVEDMVFESSTLFTVVVSSMFPFNEVDYYPHYYLTPIPVVDYSVEYSINNAFEWTNDIFPAPE